MNIILQFIKENKLSYCIGMFFVLASSFIQTLFPKILGNTIDILKLENFDPKLVKLNILFMLLIGIGTFISTYIWRNLIIGNGRKLECHLREKLFDHLQKLSPEFYNKRKTGDLIAYSTNDVSAVRMAFGPATALAVNGIVICLASIYSMYQATNLNLTLLALLPIPFIIFFMVKVGKIIHARFRRVQENFAAISDRIQENIYGIRVIKAYVQEESELENFEILNNTMMDSNLSMVKISSLLSPTIETAFSISFVLNLIIGGNMVLNGSITLGSFIAFNTYLALIMRPIISIGRIINIFQRGMASLKRLNEIFDVAPAISDGAAMVDTAIKGDIEIKNLTFSYPGTKDSVLKNISLKIPKGHTLGIIGKTGCGKTTLANLLLKLYNIDANTIFLDGIDLMDYSLKTLRESIGYIPQDNFLFSANIKDNITFFNDIYSDTQIEKAAQYGCIHDSIAALPEGFHTMLGDRGINLSGGQKQRVSISRCLIKNPNIMILDDALSAVDSITERQILHNLKSLRKDKTSILIAHKISTVMHADEILVLDFGEIVEKGTHEQLLSERGLYFDIFKEQIKDTGSASVSVSNGEAS
jgi:ATP-binding cassette, subfamily B, multidrug efflux pump